MRKAEVTKAQEPSARLFDEDATRKLGWALSQPGEGAKALAAVKKELARGADPEGMAGECPPLGQAITMGRRAAAQLLIAAGADVDRSDSVGKPMLVLAVLESAWEGKMAMDLIKAGARVDCMDTSGWTPLMHASLTGKLELAGVLIKAGASVNHEASTNWSALSAAIYREQEHGLKMVDFLVQNGAWASPALLAATRGWQKFELADRLERAQNARLEADEMAKAAKLPEPLGAPPGRKRASL